jgi:hypothetical protein
MIWEWELFCDEDAMLEWVKSPNIKIYHLDDETDIRIALRYKLQSVHAILEWGSSLQWFEQRLLEENFSIAIIDGEFLDIPNWKVGFHLSKAFDMAKKYRIQTIYVHSWRSHDEIIQHLGSGRIPDGIFQ